MQTSKIKNRILLVALVIALFVLGVLVLRRAYAPWSATQRVNYYLDQIEKEGKNVDMVFVGASRTYRGLDPEYFEGNLGVNIAVSQSTPAQRTVLSYYMVKEMLERFKPKYVVLGATFNGLMYDQGYTNFEYAMDRLSIKNRIACAIELYGPIDGTLVLLGKNEYLKDESQKKIIRNIVNKYKLSNGDQKISPNLTKKGYVGATESMPQGGINYNFDIDREFKESDIDSKAYEYFDKTVQLCKQNGVNIVLVSGTASLARVYSVKNYQGVVDYYTEYAEKNGIKYFNLNYLLDREKLFPDTVFIDDQHLNYDGGQIESKIFSQIWKDYYTGKDTDKYFYKDFDDMSKDVHRIAGCTGKLAYKNNKLILNVESVQNSEVIPEFRVIGTSDNAWNKDKIEILRDWNGKSKFALSKNEYSKFKQLKVEVRAREGDDEPAFWIVNL